MLSAAIGGKVFRPEDPDFDKVVNQIDALMYEDKELFYENQERRR